MGKLGIFPGGTYKHFTISSKVLYDTKQTMGPTAENSIKLIDIVI